MISMDIQNRAQVLIQSPQPSRYKGSPGFLNQPDPELMVDFQQSAQNQEPKFSSSKTIDTNKRSVLMFSDAFNRIVIVATTASFVLILILNAVFIDSLYFMGINMIYTLQSEVRSKVFEVFLNIVSFICNSPGIVLVFLFQMAVAKQKLKALMHISFFLMGFYFIAVFKQAFQQSRPIWSSKLIGKYEWFCPTDYGNPSGHSYVAFPLFEPVIYTYFHRSEYRKLLWGVMIFFGVTTPFSRMYLGVHSLNQVLFGMSFGLCWVVLYRYGMDSLFYRVFKSLFVDKSNKHLIVVISIHFVLFLAPLIIFDVNSLKHSLTDEEIANLNFMCSTTLTAIKLQESMMYKTISESVIFGFLYGVYFTSKESNQMQYYFGRWTYRDRKSAILHCISMAAAAVIVPGIIFGIIAAFDEPYSEYILLSLAVTLAGFLLIYLTPIIESKFGWIDFKNSGEENSELHFEYEPPQQVVATPVDYNIKIKGLDQQAKTVSDEKIQVPNNLFIEDDENEGNDTCPSNVAKIKASDVVGSN